MTTPHPPQLPRLARLEKWAPGIRVARTYNRAFVGKDVLAGVVLCALLVPQGMAYAELAGLLAITGLYTTIVCLFAYAIFGPSPFLVLGPDSSLGPMIAATVLPMAAGDEAYAVALAGMLALWVGLVGVGAGVARLGFVADLLSAPVRLGYLAGLAVTIFVGQLPKLFGFSIDADTFFQEITYFWQGLDQTNGYALSVGLLCLTVILGLKRLRPKWPGVLVAVLAAIAVTVIFDLAAKGVDVVGVLPQGFPRPTFPRVELADIPILAATAVGISLVTIGDTISTSAGFAARKGYDVDSDQEMVGIGAANLFAGFFSGFPVSTSGSRTAVAEQSGAQTQLTGVVAGTLVLLMLLAAPGLVQNLPQPALAAIVITASISLFDLKALRRLYAMRRSEFALALACALGVILVGVLEGIVIAVVLAIGQFFERSWRPYAAVLGKPAEIDGYHDMTRYPQAAQIPGLLMLRWDAPLFFANANIFRRKVRDLVAQTEPRPVWIVVAAEPVTDVDTTAAEMLVDLDEELNAGSIHLVFAELKDPVKDKMVRYGLLETIDSRHFYPTLDTAVAAFYEETKSDS
ncbi:MAG: transporter [Chloroflexota bacterium]|nr:sulfate permease [Ardenticatenaceae bacterium]GIK55496.1 MAG: transporter [Chloroflexota bacterium]